MAALQHVRSRATICSAFRQLLLIPRQNFSLSMQLEGRQRKRESKVVTRFAPIEPLGSYAKKKPASKSTVLDIYDDEPTACTSVKFDSNLVDTLLQKMDSDLPISDMPDPFVKDYERCYMCTNDIKVDYKNVRLLSQFVSPFTGRIYGRAITGLCIPMQKHVAHTIRRSRAVGYMPVMNKDPRYLQDPQPFNPMAKRN